MLARHRRQSLETHYVSKQVTTRSLQWSNTIMAKKASPPHMSRPSTTTYYNFPDKSLFVVIPLKSQSTNTCLEFVSWFHAVQRLPVMWCLRCRQSLNELLTSALVVQLHLLRTWISNELMFNCQIWCCWNCNVNFWQHLAADVSIKFLKYPYAEMFKSLVRLGTQSFCWWSVQQVSAMSNCVCVGIYRTTNIV